MSRTLLILILFCMMYTVAAAGPNSNARLYITFSNGTPRIDSLHSCKEDSTFTAGVYVTGVENLFDYEFYMCFDTSRLQYLSGSEDFKGVENFLKDSGGSIFFNSRKSADDSTRILIGASLLGDDESQCVSGSGFLGAVTFRMKSADTVRLRLAEPLLEDCSFAADENLRTYSAIVIPASSKIVNICDAAAPFRIESSGRVLKITSPDKLPAKIRVYDFNGRRLGMFDSDSRSVYFTLPGSGSGKYLLTINQNSRKFTYSYIVRK